MPPRRAIDAAESNLLVLLRTCETNPRSLPVITTTVLRESDASVSKSFHSPSASGFISENA
eukprot:scaffold228764_cov29-Tisochrysis_lutea.AAC.5